MTQRQLAGDTLPASVPCACGAHSLFLHRTTAVLPRQGALINEKLNFELGNSVRGCPMHDRHAGQSGCTMRTAASTSYFALLHF